MITTKRGYNAKLLDDGIIELENIFFTQHGIKQYFYIYKEDLKQLSNLFNDKNSAQTDTTTSCGCFFFFMVVYCIYKP